MPSLVSDFIINPVLRQARRFSSGFATEEPPAPRLQHQRTRSAGESNPAADNAIMEEGERIVGTSTSSGDSTDSGTNARPNTRRSTRISNAEPGRQISTQAIPVSTPTSRGPPVVWVDESIRSSPLPEDDGNGELRRKILGIQAMDVSQNLKAQLMHQVLIEGYMKSRHAAPTSPSSQRQQAESPISRSVPGPGPEPPGALQALKFWNPLSDGPEPLNLPLSEADLRPTYVPNVPSADDLAERLGKVNTAEDHGQPVLGCEHYRRNVKMQCAACDCWYTCRFCHDAAEDHILPRKETKNMLCMLCGCAQRASDTCIRCGESAAYYFCGVCKLWNDDPNKAIYHCNDCGLCRVGQGLGKDFFHCKKCMACISMTGGHKCIERSIDCDCPICGEYMFNSPRPVIFMQCGHSIHRRCFDEHMQTSYKCPLCNKSCTNMDAQFRSFDMAILTQPMPPEYRDARAIISCNDCSAKSQTAYHWLGLKCSLCSSYNTIQLQLLHMPGQDTSAAGAVPVTSASTPSSGAGLPLAMLREGQPLPPATRPRRVSSLDELYPHILAADGTRRRAHALERVENPSVLSRLLRSVSPDPSASAAAAVTAPASASALVSDAAAPTIDATSTELFDFEEEPHAARASDTTTTTTTSPLPHALATAASVHAASGRALMVAADTDDSEEDVEEEEDMYDFWGRSGDDVRGVVTSDGGGHEGDEDDGEESSGSSSEDGCDDDEDDDEEEEIVLFGHR